MLTQAQDFCDESQALYDLIAAQPGNVFLRETQFKHWTVDDVIAHLHMFNVAADLSLQDTDKFVAFMKDLRAGSEKAGSHLAYTHQWLDGLTGHALLDAWRQYFQDMTPRFAAADPKQRVKWAGPDMSVRSSVTARLMETWAHGQAVYDALGEVRQDADRIHNVAVIGNNTFGWTFANRKMAVPDTKPYVRLLAPSGAIWEFNDPSDDERIEGDATEFCQVVTQTRNIADVSLKVTGPIASQWMALAQCFAGAPEDPPKPGTRFVQV